MFMIDYLCEQCHRFNGLFSGRVRVPSATSQILTFCGDTRQNGHWHDEMNMETRQPCLAIWWLTVQDKQTIELIQLQAGSYNGLEFFNDAE